MKHDIDSIVMTIRTEVGNHELPLVDGIAKTNRDPFRILLCTVLSSRTKDSVTRDACNRLWEIAKTPDVLRKLSVEKIEKLIYPVGFYRNKAKNLIVLGNQLVKEYESIVPSTREELVKLKGVGRKTANLVLALAFEKDAICVDTHVHRFFNRIGYIRTKKPIETELALMKKLPKKYWKEINGLVVSYGQNICKPIAPWCSKCPISQQCQKVGVVKPR
ncbi:MAG: endonuclease III domain-containing protein [Candidatus Hodarchaeales archaeon]